MFSEQKRRKCRLPEYSIDNVAKEIRVKVYARSYTDAEQSFITSEKDENAINRHQETIKKDSAIDAEPSGNHQESIRKRLTENQNLMLLALHKDGKLTIPELSELVGISQRNISENLKKLQEQGFLERIGGRKNGYWEVKGF